jgi:ketosteroid isomerase-like protein
VAASIIVEPADLGRLRREIEMSTHLNAELLRNAYDAFEHGDLQPLLGLLSDDVEWVDLTLGPLPGTYQGKAEVPQFFGKMMDVYKGNLRVEVLDIIASDDHGIVLTHESGTVEGTPVAWNSVHEFSFSDGRVNRFVSYGSAEYQRFWSTKA